MLFVFGYRAKKIRSKSVSVLIHNSEHHQNIKSCTVSVYFQNIIDLPGDDFKPIPGSQFVVSRTANKDNTSHYQLNGRKVPFKEIAILLRDSGIDLDHNRFLILQGEVEQIALMKPKAQTEHDEGMLEFLEDIVGTSQYKQPIDDLGIKVEELNECRGEKLNRVKVVEKEKNELEGAKKEAEEYLAMKKDIALKQYRLYELYKFECVEFESRAKEKRDEVQLKVNEVKDMAKERQEEINLKTKQQKKLSKLYEQHNEKCDKAKSTLTSCEQRDVRVRQEIKNAKAQYKKITKNLEKEIEKMKEFETAPERCTKEIEEFKQKMKILEKRKIEAEEKLSEVMASLKEDTQELQDEKEVLENKLVGLSQKVNQTKSKLDVSVAELELYRDKCTVGERQLKDAKEQHKTTKDSMTKKQRDWQSMEQSLSSKKKELVQCEKELETVSVTAENKSHQLRTTRSQVEEARSSLQSHRSRGQVLESLMKQKLSGAIPGICGRLGDLGTITDKYDVAISTACGALDNVVVDNMETAVKCVQFLKENNIGTATFIGLEKLEVWRKQATSKISTPQNVPRLFDLIQVKDPKYLTAFYFGLRDTLVADHLDQATQIALQGSTRHRVVTLEGQLIDTSGTMSGGGTKVMKGRMSSKVHSDFTPQQLVHLENKLKEDEQSAEEYNNKKIQLGEKVRTLKNEISDNEKQIKQLKRDVQVLKEQEKGLLERIKELEKQDTLSTINPEELAKLEKQVQENQEEYDTAFIAADAIKSMVQGLHEEIMIIGGTRIQQQQAHVDKVKKEIDQTIVNINKATVTIKTSERNAKKCENKIKSLESERSSTEKKTEELFAELTNLEEEAKEAIEKQETAEMALKEIGDQLSEMKTELQSIESQQREVNEELLDLNHELERYNIKVKENQQKIKHFNNEIAKLPLEQDDKEELGEEELEKVDKKEGEYQITMLEERLKQMTPNMGAIEEYRKKEECHQTRLQELDAITSDRDNARREFEALRKKRLDEFMTGFSVITSKLKEMYQMITLGGDAELELVDSLDPFSEGIVFSVRPPKKSWKNISNLSGGEKTLSSLALVFALHHYKPSPLYVMDEIDAALDFKNVSIVANYIKERTKNAQFIIISLRNNMFELADRLIGIYKTDDCTKTVTIDPMKIGKTVESSSSPQSLSTPPVITSTA